MTIQNHTTTTQKIYKILFQNNEKTYEMYAEQVYQSDLYGFIVVEKYIFEQPSDVVLNPDIEKLSAEFKDVKCSYIPLHHILRIDEVDQAIPPKVLETNDTNDQKKQNVQYINPIK